MRRHNTPLFIGIHCSMMFTETGFITKKRKDYLMSDNTQPTRQGLPSLPKSTIWMLSRYRNCTDGAELPELLIKK